MSAPAYATTTCPNLAELLDGYASIPPSLDRSVTSVCDDSRLVTPGSLFFARRGMRVDARRFAHDAVASGAVAIVVEGERAPARSYGEAVVVSISDIAGAVGGAASRFYGEPSRNLSVVAVTGTNGKTSVTHLIARSCGDECALMGTLGTGRPGVQESVTHTTPGAIEVHRRMADLRDAGFDMLAMEVSSHALYQRRIESVRIETAAFTNLSRDHLDYHAGMDAYARAKASLFDTPGLANAVVNADAPFGRKLLDSISPGVETMAVTLCDGPPPVECSTVVRGRVTEEGQLLSLEIESPWGHGALATRLLGGFNAYNLLTAITVACLHGHRFETVLERLDGTEPIAGRMQQMGGGPRPLVVVDYSHTPDALHNALTALRPICKRELWCVFGCGGDRDRGKRSEMAEAAQGNADRIIVTDDNPRSEDGDAIVADILGGFAESQAVHVERDRAQAIHLAVARAGASDVVLIAGKGHEATQERDGVKLPFSDIAVARQALEARP